jgi:hypothetical protein
MPIEIEADIDQRRADSFMRGRLAQRRPGVSYGYCYPCLSAPQRDTDESKNSTSEQNAHES